MTRIFALLTYLIICVNVLAQKIYAFPDTMKLKVDNGKVINIPLEGSDENSKLYYTKETFVEHDTTFLYREYCYFREDSTKPFNTYVTSYYIIPRSHKGYLNTLNNKMGARNSRVRAGFLTPSKPIYHVGYSAEVISLYKQAYAAAQEEAAYAQQLMAGLVNHLIGMMYSLERNRELKSRNQTHVDLVNRARLRIRESLETPLTIQQVAQELGVSYSNFRKLFKEHTGLSPAIYQQDLRLQRAKELLSSTDLSIKEIAYRLDFESPDYFSAKFKLKTGLKPTEFRQ